MRTFFCLLLAVLPLRAAEIQVGAAASLTDALTEIGANYRKATGTEVRFNFAGSSTLMRQIELGAPCDLFFSADEEKMDRLAASRLIDRATRTDILSNALAIVVGRDSSLRISAPRDLLRAGRVALAETQSVPAGIYARFWLERIGLWHPLQPRLVPTENVRAALAAVAAGNADAGIVYRTDAPISRDVRIAFVVSGRDAPAIRYPAAVLRDAHDPAAARRFLKYLTGPAARAVFVRYGFEPR